MKLQGSEFLGTTNTVHTRLLLVSETSIIKKAPTPSYHEEYGLYPFDSCDLTAERLESRMLRPDASRKRDEDLSYLRGSRIGRGRDPNHI